jgi:hypothetical protein
MMQRLSGAVQYKLNLQLIMPASFVCFNGCPRNAAAMGTGRSIRPEPDTPARECNPVGWIHELRSLGYSQPTLSIRRPQTRGLEVPRRSQFLNVLAQDLQRPQAAREVGAIEKALLFRFAPPK